MAANREYELKFTMAPDVAEPLVSHPLVRPALSRRRIGHLVSTYYDTPDARLQRHRFGLRVRRSDHKIVQTLKQSGGSMIDRGEWEHVDGEAQPDVAWLRQTPLAPLLDGTDLASALAPRFTVDVTRTMLPLRHGGAEIEMALDQGSIRAGGLRLPVEELELEVKAGTPAAVLDLARRLVRDLPLTLSLASKAERGYAVGDLTWERPTEAIRPALHERMTIAEAFEAVVQACLHVFLKNAALIGDDDDEEAVHATRIALRHLRAALQLFKPALRRNRLAGVQREIKWLSDRLGAARDADVFQTVFFEPAARQDEMPGATELARLMSEHRRRAHSRLRSALAAPRARLLFVELLALSAEGVRRKARSKPYRPFVRTQFSRRRRRLARGAANVTRRSSTEMHEVRKAAKMLRYDLDLIGEHVVKESGKRSHRLQKGLKALQRCLGLIQDEEAMHEHLRKTILAGVAGDRAGSSEAVRQAAAAAKQITDRRMDRKKQLRRAEKSARRL